MTQWEPYYRAEHTLEHCKEIAAKLRASGEYAAVRIDRRKPGYAGNGNWHEFGKVFVKVKATGKDCQEGCGAPTRCAHYRA